MERQIADPPRTAPGSSRLPMLSLLLNAILLGWVGYTQFGGRFAGGDGVSLVLANDTGAAMADVSLDYPGGAFKLPALPVDKSVGTTIPTPGRFEATLTYKTADGASRSKAITIKPIGELLIVVHVIPPPAPAVAEEAEADAGEPAPTPAPTAPEARVIVSYQGENTNI